MERQRSILSYLRRPPSSAAAAAAANNPSFPDVAGTDTPPAKLPRPTLSTGTAAQPFSSILHKFARPDRSQTSDHGNRDNTTSTASDCVSDKIGCDRSPAKVETSVPDSPSFSFSLLDDFNDGGNLFNPRSKSGNSSKNHINGKPATSLQGFTTFDKDSNGGTSVSPLSKSNKLGGNHGFDAIETPLQDHPQSRFTAHNVNCNGWNPPHFDLSDDYQGHTESLFTMPDDRNGGKSFSPLSKSGKLGGNHACIKNKTPLQDHSHSRFSAHNGNCSDWSPPPFQLSNDVEGRKESPFHMMLDKDLNGRNSFSPLAKSSKLGGNPACVKNKTPLQDHSHSRFSANNENCNGRNPPHFELSDDFQGHKDSPFKLLDDDCNGGNSSDPPSKSNKLSENPACVEKVTPLQERSHSRFSMHNNNCNEWNPPHFDLGVDVLGPETPANQRFVPRLKRVQEDPCDVGKSPSPLSGSIKRAKAIQHSEVKEKVQDKLPESMTSKFEWLNPSSIRDADGRRRSDPLYDKRSLYIPPDAWKKLSASQKQYWGEKRRYMDVVLFFKVGKFYELYELDAEIGQKELDWKMTISGVGKCRQVGISESGIDYAVQKLVAKGYKVGRMEQLETSEQAKSRGPNSVIQRKLVHVSTLSTISDGSIGPEAVHLLALKEDTKGLENGSRIYGFAFLDHAALKFWVGSIHDDVSCTALGALLMQVSPKEVVYESSGLSTGTHKALIKYASSDSTKMQLTPVMPSMDLLDASNVRKLISQKGYFKGSSDSWASAFDSLMNPDIITCALGGLIGHLGRLMLDDALRNGELLPYHVYKSCLKMDAQTLVNLEIFSNNYDGGLSGTLYKYLDHCITPSGKRLLRRWICHPLRNIDEINNRLNVVEELIEHSGVFSVIAEYLRRIPDLERLLGRIKSTVGSSFELLLPSLGERLLKQRIKAFGSLVKGLRVGIDLLITLQKEDHGILALSKVINSSTICGLAELINQFEVAIDDDFPQYQDHSVIDSDGETLAFLVDLFIGKATEWSHVMQALNCIDVLQSFAATANLSCGSMSRPTFLTPKSYSVVLGQENRGPVLHITGLWHPYAAAESGNVIVPNDIYLGEDLTKHRPSALLLTGPNMGGKSTLLRATCLAVILAQLGCYVPCNMCILSPADVIFTRLGSTDRIMSGESTFFIECSETASVLQNATQDSLVLLDELGRGTSTFDGYAIAYAVFCHLVETVRCRLLFATHYHPLTKEFASHPRVLLQHMACSFKTRSGSSSTEEKDLVFLYKLAPGACPESYGLQVALMAGIPKRVVDAASTASQRMKVMIAENFKSSEGRSQFSSLHEEWLNTLLSVPTSTNSSWDEDTCDTLLCMWHELRNSYKSDKCVN